MRASRCFLIGLGANLLVGCFTDPIEPTSEDDDDGTSTAGATEPTEPTTAPETTLEPSSTVGGSSDSTFGATESSSSIGDATTGTSTGEASGTSSGGATTTGGSSTSTGAGIVCGDDLLEGEEDCDGDDVGGLECEDFGFAGGTVTCTKDCALILATCEPPPGMVFIPEGAFEMGSLDAEEEQPIREVTLSGYLIDISEVTAEAYAACVDAMFCSEPESTANFGFDDECNYGRKDRLDHPVNCTTIDQAGAYCDWVGKRLPTEAEWERAARDTDARTFPWGDVPLPSCLHAVMNDGGAGCGEASTFAVMSKPPGVSEAGLHDMAGNVWEWVSDRYGPYNAAELVDPTGPAIGGQRILRGGGWFHQDAADFTTTHRHEVNATLADAFIGFRCAMPLEQP